jgi:hypothetical protein
VSQVSLYSLRAEDIWVRSIATCRLSPVIMQSIAIYQPCSVVSPDTDWSGHLCRYTDVLTAIQVSARCGITIAVPFIYRTNNHEVHRRTVRTSSSGADCRWRRPTGETFIGGVEVVELITKTNDELDFIVAPKHVASRGDTLNCKHLTSRADGSPAPERQHHFAHE